jgi:type VI secretion system protein ImpL
MGILSLIWPYLLIAGLLIAGLVYMLMKSAVKPGSPKQGAAPPEGSFTRLLPPEEKPPQGGAADAPQASSAERRDPISVSPISVSTMRASFSSAISYLKHNVIGRDFRYDIPWFLVVSESGTGGLGLLDQAGSQISLPDEEGRGNDLNNLEWRFLRNGILVGVDYDLEADRRTLQRDGEKNWSQLLRLFLKHRPRRPIDGIVLTISAASLTQPGAAERLAARAAVLNLRWSQAQRTLAINFPVYLIVTGCEKLYGFSSFCREFPQNRQNDIFGWSSPYHVDTSYTNGWVDEAFDTMDGDLHRLQSEIFVERRIIETADETFLFPEEFARMREPLRVFLNRLFQQSVYRESFSLRGIYFTGDIAEYMPRALAGSTDVPANDVHANDPEQRLNPVSAVLVQPRVAVKPVMVFLGDLFERKILAESGLARPIPGLAISRNRTVIAIQAASLLLAVLLGAGTWLAFNRLSAERDRLVPMLRQMAGMDKIPERDRYSVLLSMGAAGSVNFRSAFLPASLFANTDERLVRAMTRSLDDGVLASLRISIAKRLEQILATEPDPAPSADKEAEPIESIEDSVRFRALESFGSQMKAFKENADVYNTLSQKGAIQDLSRIRKLIQYLYGVNLGEVVRNEHLAQALIDTVSEPFSPTLANRERASELFDRYIDLTFKDWYGHNVLERDLRDLQQRILALEKSRAATYQDLRDLLDAIKQADESFSSPAAKWIVSRTIDFNGPFRRSVQEPVSVLQGNFLAAGVMDFATRDGEAKLDELRRTVSSARTGLTGPLVEIGDAAALSPGTNALSIALEKVMTLEFMSSDPSGTIRTALDRNTRLIWRPEPLQTALKLYDSYTKFTRESLSDSPLVLQNSLPQIALGRLNLNLQSKIGLAQDFEPRSSLQHGAGEDDELLQEVNAFRDSQDLLNQLLTKLRQLGLIKEQGMLSSVLRTQATNVLALLDERLNQEDSYAAKGGNFGWWSGSEFLSFASYEVHSPAELADYLAKQRERLKFLKQSAEPFVRYLDTWAPNRTEAQSIVISRWERIISDFNQYDGKKPGAGIAALEEFIQTDMDKIRPDTACAGGSRAEPREQSLNYFLQIRAKLRHAVVSQCESLSADKTYGIYEGISSLFNKTLAGHYPFAPSPAGAITNEATPEAILEFYKVFDRDQAAARATFTGNTRFGGTAAAVLEFLNQIEQLRAFVVSPSGEAEKEPPLTFEFIPKFRVSQNTESGGNEIVEWTMQIGGTIFRNGEPEHPGRWRPGNPVRIALRWAKDSPSMPAQDSRQTNLRIRQRTALWEYTNRWALLAFLQRQAATPTDLGRSSDWKPYVLKLRANTAPDPQWGAEAPVSGSATVFLQIRLFAPGGKNAITLPVIPFIAPALDAPTKKLE